MRDAVVGRAGGADVVIMAAAVADYAPATGAAAAKLEKSAQGDAWTIALERTPDILAELGEQRGDGTRPMLVGFAAQTGDPVPAARNKLQTKKADLIVANDVSAPDAGFEVDTNVVALVSRDGVDRLPVMAKSDVAGAILDRVERGLPAVQGQSPVSSTPAVPR